MINLNSMESDDIELMEDYFNSRVDVYDEIHQQVGISWGKQIRDIIAEYIPTEQVKILDLGCGTGLELEEILKKTPLSEIVCVDISLEMLKKLKNKYGNYNVKIVNANFLDINYAENKYDFVISVMALHHFLRDDKLKIYKNIYSSLKDNGMFINSDYIIYDEELSNKKIEEYKIILENYPNKLFHFDIPFTEKNERQVLIDSGFKNIEKVYENKKTKVLVAKKR